MFMGEYHHNIDEKGRIVLPLKLRCIEMDKVVVTRGLEQCLYLYTMEEWNKFVSKLNTLPFNKKDARTITRLFFSSASICEFDRNGRINITSSLVNYAGLTKECVIIGVNDHIEVWDKTLYNKNIEENIGKFEIIAEHLLEVKDETL